MLAIGQTSVRIFNFRRRTYRQRKKLAKETCIKNPDALTCAVRHRRCPNCPFNTFFKNEELTKVNTFKDDKCKYEYDLQETTGKSIEK
jgi:hypothetical protein